MKTEQNNHIYPVSQQRNIEVINEQRNMWSHKKGHSQTFILTISSDNSIIHLKDKKYIFYVINRE